MQNAIHIEVAYLLANFFFLFYPTAVLIDHFLKLIVAPNPWTPSTDALWKIFSNLAKSISEITATGRQNREDKH